MSDNRITTYNSDPFLKKCTDTFLSLGKIMLRSKAGVKLPKSDTDSIIVLGNGPSLKQSLNNHPAFFKQHELLCVNSFSLTKEYIELKPKFYVMLDPGLWLSKDEAAVKTFEALVSKTNWKITLFIPRTASGISMFSEIANANKNITVLFFNYTVYKGFSSIGNWLYKKNWAMPQSQNVLVASLFLSVNMDFKNIYLFGADHSWHQNLYVNEDNMLCTKDIHFYDNKEEISYRFFYKGMHLKETFSIHEIFSTWAKIFLGYFSVNEYAKYRNSNIYNASGVSFIDAFKRIKIP